MSKQTIYSSKGLKSTKTIELNSSVFDISKFSHELIKSTYTASLSNSRQNLAVTKTRGLVRGSNIKPWRQKGTGRARVGSKRTPLWRGGGIIFGPTGQENYSVKVNKKARSTAIRQALSSKNNAKQLLVIDALELKEPKTALFKQIVDNLKLIDSKFVLFIDDKLDPNTVLASNNLSNVFLCTASHLLLKNVIDADYLVITSAAINELNDRLAVIKKPTSKPKEQLVT